MRNYCAVSSRNNFPYFLKRLQKVLVASKHTNANITKRKTLKEDIDGKG